MLVLNLSYLVDLIAIERHNGLGINLMSLSKMTCGIVVENQ